MRTHNPLDRARAAFAKAVANANYQNLEIATLGWRKSETDVVITVPGKLNRVYITKRDSTVVQAINEARVPHQAFLRVKVAFEGNNYVIKAIDRTREEVADTPDDPYGAFPHPLSVHTDVTVTSAAAGDVLAHNGSSWVDETPVTTSAGAGDAGKLVRLDAGGQIDDTMLPAGQDPVADQILAAATDDTIADADIFGYVTGTTLVKTAWSNIKALIASAALTFTNKTLDSTNISTLTAKNPPVDADSAVIVDSAASNVFKAVTYTNIKAFLKTYFDTLYVALTGDQTVGGKKNFTDNTLVGGANAAEVSQLSVGEDVGYSHSQHAGIFVRNATNGAAAGSIGGAVGFSNGSGNSAVNRGAAIYGFQDTADADTTGLGFAVHGTASGDPRVEALKLLSDMSAIFAGFVGIGGVTTPEQPLHVTGSAGISVFLFENNRWMGSKNSAGTAVRIFGLNSVDDVYLGAVDNAGGRTIIREDGNNVIILDGGIVMIGGLTSVGASRVGIKAGNSSNDAAVGGMLFVSTTQVGNVGTGEDDLASYSVPANTLAANGQSLWFEASGSYAANTNNKTIRVRFGTAGTNLMFTAPVVAVGAGGSWVIRGRILRTGAATQKALATFMTSALTVEDTTGLTSALDQTLSGAVTFKVTGEAVSNNDILLETLVVGWDDANA